MQDRRPRWEAQAKPVAAPAPAASSAQLNQCLAEIPANPLAASESAEQWRDQAKAGERAAAQLCLGSAYAQLERWDDAEEAFLAGRNEAGATSDLKARLAAMAGNAALAQGQPDRALGLLDNAKVDQGANRTMPVALDIELDRSRALVALKRTAEAEAALADARSLDPKSAEAWLLSATLSRRENKLDVAQAQIEQAVQLLPVDPEIGLEAGVIAMLAGREDAARKSWQSVLAAAPNSPVADTARGYLAQLGSAANSAPSSATPPATPQP